MDYSAPLTEAALLALLDRGAVEVTFHPTGAIRSVRFAPTSDAVAQTQPITPAQEAERIRSVARGAAGGLKRYGDL